MSEIPEEVQKQTAGDNKARANESNSEIRNMKTIILKDDQKKILEGRVTQLDYFRRGIQRMVQDLGKQEVECFEIIREWYPEIAEKTFRVDDLSTVHISEK